MIIGEGPGANEARLKQPFVGLAGSLLDQMLKRSGLKREETYITNATSCQPPPKRHDDDRTFEDLHPYAVPACQPRLLREIHEAQPRVILILGNQALLSLTGTWHEKSVKRPRFVDAAGNADVCPVCRGAATLPFWEHTKKSKGCGGVNYLPAGFSTEAGKSIGWQQCGVCQQPAEATVGVRKKRCPHCEGRKQIEDIVPVYKMPFRITQVAGTVFRGRFAPDVDKMAPEARLDLPCAYVIPSYHPSAIQRQPEKKNKQQKAVGGQFLFTAALAHMQKAARLLESDAYWPFEYAIVNGEPGEPAAAPGELEALLATGATTPVSVDIEAPDKEPWLIDDITCIGFHSPLAPRAITVRTDGLRPGHPLIDSLRSWLGDGRFKKSLQHGIYDTQSLWRLWSVEVAGWVFDTQVAHNACYSDAPHDLQHITGHFTDSPPWKPPKEVKGKLLHESSAAQRVYNARDCFNTSLSRVALERELDVERVRFVHDLDIAMFACAREMERVGLPIDPERWTTWRTKATFYRDNAEAQLRATLKQLGAASSFIDTFNPDSPPQLGWVLYAKDGPCRLTAAKYTEPSAKHPKGQPSTDKSALLAHKGHPFVDVLLDFRRWDKVLSTYMKETVVYQDWRLRVQWNPLGARTGRWSTKGINAQNWFKSILVHIRDGQIFPSDAHLLERANDNWLRIPGIREIVVAPLGRLLVGADLSQAELRVLAALAGEAAMVEILTRGDAKSAELKAAGRKEEAGLLKYDPYYDIHSYVASIAFGDTYLHADPRTKHGKEVRERLRDLIKRVIYGLNYGAGTETILEAIYDGGYEGPPLTEADIVSVMNAYFSAFPRIREWRESTVREAQRTGIVRDALIGRRREYPLRLVPSTEAMNFAIQATVGSLMNLTLWELMQALPSVDPGARIIAQIHDAIYIECAEDRADDVAKLLEAVMTQDLRLVPGAPYMRFPAAAKVATDWYQAG